MEADLGHNPSFIWRGIWSSQAIIARGYRWRIGDSNAISVWKDPWIHDPRNLFIQSPMPPNLQPLKVSDLFVPFTTVWNTTLLHDIFNDRDIHEISSLPISHLGGADTRIWHFSRDGNYHVKSGYRIAMSLTQVHGTSMDPKFWKLIWSIKIPPKGCSFMWKACRDCLLNRFKLQMRGIQIAPTCVVCD